MIFVFLLKYIFQDDRIQQDQERNNKQVNFDVRPNDDAKLQKRSCDPIKNVIQFM